MKWREETVYIDYTQCIRQLTKNLGVNYKTVCHAHAVSILLAGFRLQYYCLIHIIYLWPYPRVLKVLYVDRWWNYLVNIVMFFNLLTWKRHTLLFSVARKADKRSFLNQQSLQSIFELLFLQNLVSIAFWLNLSPLFDYWFFKASADMYINLYGRDKIGILEWLIQFDKYYLPW